MRLMDKIVIVTGAGGAIGRSSALLFAKEGAQVIATDLKNHAAEETAEIIKAEGGRCLAFSMDVSNSTVVTDVIHRVEDRFGRIDVLFNNAAISSHSTVADITDEELDRVLTVNLKGVIYCCRAVLSSMVAHKSGAIVNNASINGIVGAPGMAAYAASKGAVISLTRTLALEQAENGIRANCICPASVDTPMLQASFDAMPDPEKARATNVKRHPLGRLGTPEDVAKLALFLASDESGFITGGTYVIDGGALIARRWQN
jgi:NAD(P)-dependent dehydrogenase (short-subunit alcohol dehydrogenase family)